MKANPDAVASASPVITWATKSASVWLSLSALYSALAFTPELEHRLEVSGLDAYAQFGTVVDVHGDTAVVGCPSFVIDRAYVGAAFVFVSRDGHWIHQATLLPQDNSPETEFGSAVAISQDTIVVGAYRDAEYGPYSGTAYVFARTGDVWSLEAKLTPADARRDLQFGDPVAIDGERIVVGAIADSDIAPGSGAVYLFRHSESGWQEETKLKPKAPVTGALFGFSVSLNGNLLAVGAPFHTYDSLSSAGAAYVFEESDGVWTETAQLTSGDPAAYSLFGWSVAVTSDRLLAGAPRAWEGTIAPGAAYLFGRSDSRWLQSDKLTDPMGTHGAWFGFSVALDADLAAVGASQDSTFGESAGAICLYAPNGGRWQQNHKLNTVTPADYAEFGFNLAYDGNSLIVGAPFYDETLTPMVGAAFVFSGVDAPPSNQPPLADASDSSTRVLALNNRDAEVLLDGSRSSDPDGQTLSFRWFEHGTLIAETQTALVRLRVGTHTIALEVSDGFSVDTDSVDINVLAPADALDELIDQLHSPGLPAGQARALQRFVISARRALAHDRLDQAVHFLQIARHYLHVQAGRRIDPSIARTLDAAISHFADALQAR